MFLVVPIGVFVGYFFTVICADEEALSVPLNIFMEGLGKSVFVCVLAVNKPRFLARDHLLFGVIESLRISRY